LALVAGKISQCGQANHCSYLRKEVALMAPLYCLRIAIVAIMAVAVGHRIPLYFELEFANFECVVHCY